MLWLMGKTPGVLSTRMWWSVAESRFYPLAVIKDEEKYILRESTVWLPKKPKNGQGCKLYEGLFPTATLPRSTLDWYCSWRTVWTSDVGDAVFLFLTHAFFWVAEQGLVQSRSHFTYLGSPWGRDLLRHIVSRSKGSSERNLFVCPHGRGGAEMLRSNFVLTFISRFSVLREIF